MFGTKHQMSPHSPVQAVLSSLYPIGSATGILHPKSGWRVPQYSCPVVSEFVSQQYVVEHKKAVMFPLPHRYSPSTLLWVPNLTFFSFLFMFQYSLHKFKELILLSRICSNISTLRRRHLLTLSLAKTLINSLVSSRTTSLFLFQCE